MQIKGIKVEWTRTFEHHCILGPFVDKAVVEPLHLANNNWQFLFTELLTYVIYSKTVIPSSS